MPMARLFSHRSTRNDPGIFRQIPLHCPGRLFVSPMPFGAYDTRNRVLALYREHKIHHVFMLVTDEELQRKARRDLKREYEKAGIRFSQIAIRDMTAPDLDTLREYVAAAHKKLMFDRIAVHCHAGVGRTSVFTCCLVQAVEEIGSDASIEYVKKHMEVNMTSEQMNVVHRFGLIAA